MRTRLVLALALALGLAIGPAAGEDALVVYSARKEHLVKPLFDAFARETGVAVRSVTDREGPLLERLLVEGGATPADMLVTVDASSLWQAAEAGVLAPVHSEVLEREVPPHLRDPQGRWYALSLRARTVVYHTERVRPEELSTYEDLADPRWKRRLCLSSGRKTSNQSLVAAILNRLGEQATERVVRGWLANLGAEPFADDSEVLEAIAAGLCDLGLVNSYYYARYAETREGAKLAIFWLNQDTTGVHLNVSGAGVTAHARHPEAARRLLEWLAAPQGQSIFADLNMEYPANPLIAAASAVAAWGTFKADPLNLTDLGRLHAAAVTLMDRAGYR